MIHTKTSRARSCALAFALLALAPATHAARATDSLIASGGSIQLDAGDVRALVAALPAGTRRSLLARPGSLEQLVRQEILRRSLVDDARAARFSSRPATAAVLRRVRDDALMRLWLASQASVPADFPSASQVQSAYDLLRKNAPYEYHLEQIFIAAPNGGSPRTVAAALRKAVTVRKLIATTSFEKLARQDSDDTASASHGGNLGFLPAAKLLPDIRSAVESMTPGQTIGPIKTSAGLHFLKLIAKRRITIPPLAKVHDRIVAALRTQRGAQLERAYLRRVASKLDVTVDQIALAKLQSALK